MLGSAPILSSFLSYGSPNDPFKAKVIEMVADIVHHPSVDVYLFLQVVELRVEIAEFRLPAFQQSSSLVPIERYVSPHPEHRFIQNCREFLEFQ